jgi:uncharacterized membrane protein
MKKWFQSKTVWFNVITAVVTLAGELSNIFPITKHPAIYTTIITVGNLLLRLITTEAIGTDKK